MTPETPTGPRVVVFSGTDPKVWEMSHQWRVGWPLAALRERGYPVEHREPSRQESLRLLVPGPQRPAIVSIPRGLSGPWTRENDNWISVLRQAGIRVLAATTTTT